MIEVLKFAVVREDANVEAELIREIGAQTVLLVASGGCTALTLARRFPGLNITIFDINAEQLQHVRAKQAAAARGDHGLLNIGDSRTDGLNQSGDFESLFRMLRRFTYEFVASRKEVYAFFDVSARPENREALLERWFRSPYWPTAFTLFFHDEFLETMFGPDAIQHAPANSYPVYFREVLERGLRHVNAPFNPFLQHIFLGHYLPAQAPEYLGPYPDPPLEMVEGSLDAVEELKCFDLISLSNLCDWSDDERVCHWANDLTERARPGSMLLLRTLNNDRDLRQFFEPAYAFDDSCGASMLAADRSLFYNRIDVARLSTNA